MKVNRIVLHHLYLSPKREVSSVNTAFDIEAYSRFKYGDTRVAQQYAEALARKATKYYHTSPQIPTKIALTSSAFRYTPTAAQSITDTFFECMTHGRRIEMEYFKIHRTFLDGRDYAQLTPEERKEVLQKASLKIDQSQSLYDKTVWVIDDVRITGKHEEKVLHFLKENAVREVLFLYVANLAQGSEMSWVEHYLNHAWVKNIQRFAQIVEQPYFQINARVCKFLLSYPCHSALQDFFEALSDSRIRLFYRAAKEDEFDKIPVYQQGFQLLAHQYERCQKIEPMIH